MVIPVELHQTAIAAASAGDVQMQSALVDTVLDLPRQGFCSEEEALVGAELLARICAARGGIAEGLRLASILMKRADYLDLAGDRERHAVYLDQTIDVLTPMANAGDKTAGAALIGIFSNLADQGDESAAVDLQTAVKRYGSDAVAMVSPLLQSEGVH